MHRIYFEKRCIIICEPGDQALADPNAMEFHVGEKIDIRTLVLMFEGQTMWWITAVFMKSIICRIPHR